MIQAQFEGLLKNNQPVVRVITGTSMYPTLVKCRDVVVIEPLKAPLKVNDVVLYKSSVEDVYILHRILRIKGEKLVIRGDNNCFYERQYTKSDILGIMTGFYKGDKFINCDTNKAYKCYVFFSRATFYPRAVYRFFKRLILKIIKKI